MFQRGIKFSTENSLPDRVQRSQLFCGFRIMSKQRRWSIVFNYESENASLILLAIAVHELVFIPILGIRKLNKTASCPRLPGRSHKTEGQNSD